MPGTMMQFYSAFLARVSADCSRWRTKTRRRCALASVAVSPPARGAGLCTFCRLWVTFLTAAEQW